MISCFASAWSAAADVVLDLFCSVLLVVDSDDDVACYDLTP